MKLNFYTDNFTSTDGYGNSAIRIIQALENSGFDIRLVDIKKIKMAPDSEVILKKFLQKPEEVCDTILCFSHPSGFHRVKAHQKLIGYTMFETTILPKELVNKCNICDLVLVPATQLKQIFQDNGVTVPIEVLLLFVGSDFYYTSREINKLFTFLFLGTIDEFNRKGWYELFEAFSEEFSRTEAQLILKSPFINLDKCMVDNIRNFRNIHLLSGILEHKQVMDLFKQADCFVFPTHGEGFGLTPLEAMATGLPTIVTDWLGCAEYADERYCYPLKVDFLEPAIYAGFPDNIGNWAVIDSNRLKSLMRHVYLNRNEAKIKGQLAAQYVDDNFRAQHFVKRFIEILQLPKSQYVLNINKKKIISNSSDLTFLAHHISQSEGYGCLCSDLMKHNYSMVIQEIRDDLQDNKKLKLSDISLSNTVIQVSAGDLFKRYPEFKQCVGYTMFETTKLPKHWAQIMNGTCDSIVVPSEEVKYVFIRCGVTIPIHVVPLWVNDIYQYYLRPKREIYKFLWTGKLDKFNRKGWRDAIIAFKKEFKNEENVQLIIKTAKILLNEEDKKELYELIKGSNIKIVEGIYSNEELYEVYKSVDCFLFPTHGEGFGLPPLEAMATGLPAIITNWMGCTEFAHSKYCYPIKVDKLEKAFYPAPYGDVGMWAQVDIQKVRKLMRYVFENKDKAKKKGREAARYVHNTYRIKHFDINLRKSLNLPMKSVDDTISIVLAIKDNLSYFKTCVESIYNYTKENFELILIDNGSNEEVKAYLKELKRDKKNISIITNSENMGYAYACNQGIKKAKGNYICMLDIDTIVTPGWLSEMLACMKSNDKIGIVVPSQSYLDSMIYVPFNRNAELPIQEDVANFSQTLAKGNFIEEEFNHVYGFCHLVKKKVYEDIGGYDYKRYKDAAVNETDLFWRAKQKKYKIYWAKGAYVYHFHGVVKKSLGLNDFDMVNEGNKRLAERQQLKEYFVENDVLVNC